MENIEIWTLDGAKATPLDAVGQVESERDLEDTLVDNPALLMDGLTLVGRQIATEGGDLDLLGVDKYGRLVVFELKRGTLRRDAVAQVIDYASDLEGRDWANLCNLISENSGSNGIEKFEDFDEWYGLEPQRANPKPIRMAIVGLGADAQTERMVKFLADDNGMDISLLTFHGFELAGNTLLAKHVEAHPASERGLTVRYASRSEKWNALDQRVEEYGARELFDAAVEMFRKTWGGWRDESPQKTTLTLTLPTIGTLANSRRTYAGVGVDENVKISFHHRALTLCEDAFKQAMKSMEYQTFPQQNQDPWERPDSQVLFPLTADSWERHKCDLSALAQAVYDAWKNKNLADETDSAE